MKSSELIKEKSGKLSSLRLVFMIWALGVLAAWGYVSHQSKQLAAIPESIIAILGLMLTGKVTQRAIESKDNQPPIAPPDLPK